MSENPMGGFGAPLPELPEDPATPARDPRVLIGGGIALAAVALVGGYLFLGGGGGSTPTATDSVIHHTTPTTTATVIPVGKPTAAVRTFKGDVGRDPFRALVTSPPAPTVAAVKPTTSTVPTVTPTSPGSVIGTGGLPTLPVGSTPTAAPTAVPTTTTPPVAKVLVVLKAIAFHGTTPYVAVTYSGAQYALKTGDTAGASLKVLAIAPDDGSATFQLGDQTFDLHIGQTYVG
ncbi:MAG: hypothetical protein QOE24_1258 [Frankiales bacterium]|nr:hypothetical protein [Frankiales bacterium]